MAISGASPGSSDGIIRARAASWPPTGGIVELPVGMANLNAAGRGTSAIAPFVVRNNAVMGAPGAPAGTPTPTVAARAPAPASATPTPRATSPRARAPAPTPSPTPSPGGSLQPAQRVVGYFPLWLRNSGYTERDIDFSVVNVVAHFSVVPRGDGSIEIPTWGPFPDSALVATAHSNGAKIVLVVGGDHEAATGGFAQMASSAATRQTFIANLMALLDQHGYDGVDLDWEFPRSAEDRSNLTALVKELRAALGAGRSLSIAAPASDYFGRWFDLPAILPYLDWVGAMTYHLHGPGWSGHSGHNAALYSPPADSSHHWSPDDNLSLDSARKYYLGRGVPRSKLLLGVPFYGQRFDGATAMHQELTSTDGGYMPYPQVAALVGNGWTRHFDDAAAVPYLVRHGGPGVISYDDPGSVAAKCRYTKAQGLRGVILWHVGQDRTGGQQPLLSAARECR